MNSIIANRRLSWTQVDYTVLMGHVSFLSNAIPSIHAGRKCSCEIQSHLSEVKWESFPALPSSLAKTLIACPAFCSQAGLIPHRLGRNNTHLYHTDFNNGATVSGFRHLNNPPKKVQGATNQLIRIKIESHFSSLFLFPFIWRN